MIDQDNGERSSSIIGWYLSHFLSTRDLKLRVLMVNWLAIPDKEHLAILWATACKKVFPLAKVLRHNGDATRRRNGDVSGWRMVASIGFGRSALRVLAPRGELRRTAPNHKAAESCAVAPIG